MRAARAVAVAALAATCACASSGPYPADLAAAVDPGTPGWRLEREHRLVLGRASLALARAVVRMADEDDEAIRILAGLRRVEVCTYRVVRRGETALGALAETAARLHESGWEPVVTVRDGAETTWVMQHARSDGRLDRLLVLELDGGSLEVVRLDGDIEKVVAEAVAERPGETLAPLGRSSS